MRCITYVKVTLCCVMWLICGNTRGIYSALVHPVSIDNLYTLKPPLFRFAGSAYDQINHDKTDVYYS